MSWLVYQPSCSHPEDSSQFELVKFFYDLAQNCKVGFHPFVLCFIFSGFLFRGCSVNVELPFFGSCHQDFVLGKEFDNKVS